MEEKEQEFHFGVAKQAFDELEKASCKACLFQYADFDNTIYISPDASGSALSAILSQKYGTEQEDELSEAYTSWGLRSKKPPAQNGSHTP